MNNYFSKLDKDSFIKIYDKITKEDLFGVGCICDEYKKLKCVKFVPTSGAATRMFSHLYEFSSSNVMTKEVEWFLSNLSSFAFYEDIKDKIKHLNDKEVIEYILKSGLGYGDLPKALIKMHRYYCFSANPIDEHIYEAKKYLNKDNAVIHFTISEDHERLFVDYINSIKDDLDNIKIEFSFQDKSTDSIAIDCNNNPVFLENGEFLHRPSGHGALLSNLNSIDADMIFIKNIDNVCHRDYIDDTVNSKKRLASVGIFLKAKIDNYIKDLLNDCYNLEEISYFINDVLKIEYKGILDKNKALAILDRPLRVCGVVRNQGDVGGGPYLVDDGEFISPQIVEGVEIDLDKYKDIVSKSEYFNPVDLVCMVRRYNGEKYNLFDFVNHDRYMVVEKSYEGKMVRYLERPGLWNGSMHYWNSVFVEVDITTFNPVKNVNDLLKEKHIGKFNK